MALSCMAMRMSKLCIFLFTLSFFSPSLWRSPFLIFILQICSYDSEFAEVCLVLLFDVLPQTRYLHFASAASASASNWRLTTWCWAIKGSKLSTAPIQTDLMSSPTLMKSAPLHLCHRGRRDGTAQISGVNYEYRAHGCRMTRLQYPAICCTMHQGSSPQSV